MSRAFQREQDILRLLGEGNLDPKETADLIDELNEIHNRQSVIKIKGNPKE